jgi:hypothetical protein
LKVAREPEGSLREQTGIEPVLSGEEGILEQVIE